MPPAVIAGGIAAVGTIGGALIGSHAQSQAAQQAAQSQNGATQAQLQLGQEALGLNQSIHNSNYNLLSPFVSRGNVAGNDINALLGLPSAPVLASPVPSAPVAAPAQQTGPSLQQILALQHDGIPGDFKAAIQAAEAAPMSVSAAPMSFSAAPMAAPAPLAAPAGVQFAPVVSQTPVSQTPGTQTAASRAALFTGEDQPHVTRIPQIIGGVAQPPHLPAPTTNPTTHPTTPTGGVPTSPAPAPAPTPASTSSGSISPQQAMENFANSAGMQFQLKQGENAIQNNYAERGALDSGAAMKALQNYGQQTALNNFFLPYMGLLAGQQATGAQAGAAVAGVGSSFGNSAAGILGNMGGAIQNGADANANAALVNGANQANLFGGIGTAIGNLGSSFFQSQFGGGGGGGGFGQFAPVDFSNIPVSF